MSCAIRCFCAPARAIRIWQDSTGRRLGIRRYARCCGVRLAELREPFRFEALRRALSSARDDESPDWAAIGQPVAALLDTIRLQHPRPKPIPAPKQAPELADIEKIIRICGAHLLRAFGANGFIPTYAAFNLIGDPDLRGRELLMALTGLNSRGYKNSTLLFNLARISSRVRPPAS